MYAVIKTGGKQYKVAAGNLISVDKIAGDAGETISFDEVLLVGGEKPEVGSPLVAGAAVQGEIVGQERGDKIIVFKKRRRKKSKRTRGHRQEETLVRITEIVAGGEKPAAKKAKASPAPAADANADGAAAEPAEAKAAAEPKPAAKAKDAKTPSKEADSGARGGVEKPKPARKPRAKTANKDGDA